MIGVEGPGWPDRPPSRVELATNVDDVTGEVLAHTVAELLAAGALDAWATPIVMKKGRPAHTIRALRAGHRWRGQRHAVPPRPAASGVRATTVRRHAVERSEFTVEVGGHAIRVKRGGAG